MRKLLIYSLLILMLGITGCDDDDNGINGTPLSNHPEGRLYITNQADQTVYVYDTETLTLIDSFTTNVVEPHFVNFSHDYQYYYVLGRQVGGMISKYRTNDDSLIATITAPGAVFPTSFVISNNNDTMYVTDFTNDFGHIHRYNVSGTNFQWLDSTLQTGKQTHDIRISSDGQLIVSAGYSSDDITVINTTTGNLLPISLIDGDNIFNPTSNRYGGYGVLIDQTKSMAIVSCRKSVTLDTVNVSPLQVDTIPQDQIRLVDLNNSTILDSILLVGSNTNDTEPIYMALAPDNNILFVANNRDNSMSVVRLSTRDVIETIDFSVPKAFGITISDDGSRVYVGCTNTRPSSGMIYVIDGETYEKIDSIQVGSEPFGLQYIPIPADSIL